MTKKIIQRNLQQYIEEFVSSGFKDGKQNNQGSKKIVKIAETAKLDLYTLKSMA